MKPFAICFAIFGVLCFSVPCPAGKPDPFRAPEWFRYEGDAFRSFRFVEESYPPLVPEGERIEDVEALITDIVKRNERKKGHRISFYSICISPDGRYLASESSDRIIRIWDLHCWREVRRIKEKLARNICFSPDGNILAAIVDHHRIAFWDVATGEELQRSFPMGETLAFLAFSPTGGTIVSATGHYRHSRGVVRLWDLPDLDRIRSTTQLPYKISSIYFSPDGRFLMIGTIGNRFYQLDLETEMLRIRPVVKGCLGPRISRSVSDDSFTSVAYNPMGDRYATSSSFGGIQIWHTETGKEMRQINGIGNWMMPWVNRIRGWSFSHSLYGKNKSRSFSLMNVGLKWIAEHCAHPSAMVWNPKGDILAAISFNKGIQFWEPDTGRLLGRMKGEARKHFLPSMVFTPDGKLLASNGGYKSNRIQLWDVATRKLAGILTAGKNGLWAAADLRTGRTYRYDDGTLLLQKADGKRVSIPERPFENLKSDPEERK